MADFGTHGGHGGAIYGVLARVISQDPVITAVAYAYGFLEGSWPDIAGFFKALTDLKHLKVEYWPFLFGFKMPMRVDVYHKYHAEYRGHWWEWLPGLRLHVKIVDPPFHAAGANWFPREWKRYLTVIALALAGIFFTFF